MPIIQYIGSDPTSGPQQQIARRRALEQTSVTLGLADADPTIRGTLTGGDPYQRRYLRDSTYSTVGSNLQWQRKRLSTNELGLADYDPNVRVPWNYANPYHVRYIAPWWRPQPQKADQSDRTDPLTLHRVPQIPYQLYDRTYWTRTKSILIDQSDQQADPNTHMPAAYTNPWQLRTTLPWQRTKPIFIDQSDQPILDADPTLVRIPSSYARPYQLYDRSYWLPIKPPLSDQSDQGTITPTPTTATPGGANLGRRGPYYPNRTPEQVLREEEEIMTVVF